MKPGELRYKNYEVYLSNSAYPNDEKLSEIEFWIIENYGMTVTCAHREKRNKNDLHGTIPVRAKDIRSWCYENPKEVAEAINKRWTYNPEDPSKVVALLHNSGQGVHIHLQVHPNTKRR